MSSKYARKYEKEIAENQQHVIDEFSNRCAMNPAYPADVVHEIIPKSQRPRDWWEVDNMVPLSSFWHEKIHSDGANQYVDILREKREGIGQQ